MIGSVNSFFTPRLSQAVYSFALEKRLGEAQGLRTLNLSRFISSIIQYHEEVPIQVQGFHPR